MSDIQNSAMIINELKNQFKNVFDSNLCNAIREFEVKFNIEKNVRPIVKKACSMPYALKPKVERKIQQIAQVGILKPVGHSE